jgi:hypothetical protein
LYRLTDTTRDDIDSQIGRRIYEEFTKVVVLRKQNRVTDPKWKAMLTGLRMGEATDNDVKMVKSLVLTPESMESMEMLGEQWRDACLVTPCHRVRQHWNDAALTQWCTQNGHQILVCTAEDSLTAKKTSSSGRILENDTDSVSEKQRRTPPRTIDIGIGMKVMVTKNLETDRHHQRHLGSYRQYRPSSR